MFEQEIEMEQRQSSVVPLLLIIAMILAFVGVAAYYVIQNKKVLSVVEANSLITASLKSDGPVTIHFQTGRVAASMQERPQDANYRLLEKAGLVKIGKDNGHFTPGINWRRAFFAEIPGVVKLRIQGQCRLYLVPSRAQAGGSPEITMTGTGSQAELMGWPQ
jgi:hypothetical protein